MVPRIEFVFRTNIETTNVKYQLYLVVFRNINIYQNKISKIINFLSTKNHSHKSNIIIILS